MGGEAFQGLIVERLHRGFLDRTIHALGLPIGPRMVRLGQLVRDAVGQADPPEFRRSSRAIAGIALLANLAKKGSQR